MRKKAVQAVLSCCCVTMLLAGCGKQQTESKAGPIKIGALLPYTTIGDRAKKLENAAALAVSDINAAGGVLGQQLELVLGDYHSNAAADVEAGAIALADKGVVAILGTTGSGSTLAAFRAVRSRGILVISPGATSVSLTGEPDDGLLFRTASSDAVQGRIGASYAYNTMNKRNVVVLHSSANYSTNLGQVFDTAFTALGGTVHKVSYAEDPSDQYTSTDFLSLWQQVLAHGPDLVYITAAGDDGVREMIVLRDDLHYPNFANAPDLLATDGNHAAGCSSTAAGFFTKWHSTNQDPGDPDFGAHYAQTYGTADDASQAYAYDAIQLMAYSMLAAKSTDAVTFAPQMQLVSKGGTKVKWSDFAAGKALVEQGTDIDYEGASGPIELDDNGDPTVGGFTISKCDGTKLVLVPNSSL